MTDICYVRKHEISLQEYNEHPQEKVQAKKPRSAFASLGCHSFHLFPLGYP